MKKTKRKKKRNALKLVVSLAILGGISYGYFYIKKESLDKESPVITANDIIVTEGDEVDLLKDVIVKDNIDQHVQVRVSDDYDLNKPGKYKITYSATDKANNKATKEVYLIVNKKITNTPTNYEEGRIDFVTSKGFSGYILNGITYIDGVLITNKTYSLPKTYGNGLTNDTKKAFEDMKAVALTDGISLWICSGFRSYDTQNNLYNSYVNRDGKEKADTYSARPGYSEHQSGLAMDINKASSSFNGTPEANWLSKNAYKFGFILRYPDGKTDETGYKYESWHYRYVGKDLAAKLYNDGDWITLEDYYGITSKYAN